MTHQNKYNKTSIAFLVSNIHENRADEFSRMQMVLNREFFEAAETVEILSNLGLKCAETLVKTSDDKEKNVFAKQMSVLKSSLFLIIFEGLYVSRIDVLVLLLVESGHDLFDLLRSIFLIASGFPAKANRRLLSISYAISAEIIGINSYFA